MDARKLTDDVSVAAQVTPDDVRALAEAGYRAIVCNRPDGEGEGQPGFAEIEAAARQAGLAAAYLPVESGKVEDAQARAFGALLVHLPKPVLAYCRTGTRSTTLWTLSEGARGTPPAKLLSAAGAAGYDMAGIVQRIGHADRPTVPASLRFSVVIVGAGSAGLAAAASLKARKPDLEIAVIDPARTHYYQPGWTLVGAGIFGPRETGRPMAALIPAGVHRIETAVAAFEPDRKAVILEDGRTIRYDRLVVAPGLTLDWDGIAGLSETLGRNGVTSNYRYDLAPYTWELVKGLSGGRAVFTQPPMPIKCAGAPQKALYLSADHWQREGRLGGIAVDFYNAGAVLFGVKEYVPPLMAYVERYAAALHFGHTLTRIDGPGRRAWFARKGADGASELVETGFDMIHVVPPQRAPDCVRTSPLADAAGWVEVDPATLRHARFADVYALGDACNTPNAKTAAAVRKQAPVVAHNLLRDLGAIRGPEARYDGYGSCPLTVERGKILLAEFGYGGKLLPSFPAWLIDGTKPSRLAWLLKERLLPPIYWNAMLRGREWMARPALAL